MAAADGGSPLVTDGAEKVPAAGDGAADLLQGAVHRLVHLAAPQRAGEVEPLVVPEGEKSAGVVLLLPGDPAQETPPRILRLRRSFYRL